MSPTTFPGKWARRCATHIHTALSFIVFLWLDFFEILLCIVFRYLDKFFEGKVPACQCVRNGVGNEENGVSETLHGRKNIFREIFIRKWDDYEKIERERQLKNRWSDCGCESCVAWIKKDEQKLHFQLKEPPSEVDLEDSSGKTKENVILLHGFLSSSSFWKETVFPNLSEHQQNDYRLFAVDLLGFGRSPKPRDSLYTLKDHLEMIEKSVIFPFEFQSFHMVAHSMGCIIALALAAKHFKLVKSITLVAPPCFPPASEDGASLEVEVLKKVAERRLWPPSTFGTALMSWYEHLGRCACFFICRNHRTWESILKLLTRRRDLNFMIMDLTKHTHRSAWFSMHNVICGAARHADGYLETLAKSRVKLCVIQGDQDQTVPMACSQHIKSKVPEAEINIIANANHRTVILDREKEFTQSLEQIWASSDRRLNLINDDM